VILLPTHVAYRASPEWKTGGTCFAPDHGELRSNYTSVTLLCTIHDARRTHPALSRGVPLAESLGFLPSPGTDAAGVKLINVGIRSPLCLPGEEVDKDGEDGCSASEEPGGSGAPSSTGRRGLEHVRYSEEEDPAEDVVEAESDRLSLRP